MEQIILIPGMVIKSNYSDRRHKIIGITHNCKCPRYTDELGYTNTGMQKESPEHIHIQCKDMEDNMKSFFSGFLERDGKIKSIWQPTDQILVISTPSYYQLELFN